MGGVLLESVPVYSSVSLMDYALSELLFKAGCFYFDEGLEQDSAIDNVISLISGGSLFLLY